MPTVGVDTKITLSTKEARTVLTGFHKAIASNSATTKTLVLGPGLSGSLDLSQSDFVVIIGKADSLIVTLTNIGGETQTIENSGFVMIHASNLDSVVIQNTDSEEQQLTLIF